MRRLSAAFFFACLVLGADARGGTIVVDTLADGITGPLCELRDAITAADLDQTVGGCDAGDGDDTIDLRELEGTIELGSDLPIIDSDVTIRGNHVRDLTISGEGAHRVFYVRAGNVTIRDLTIANAAADRGAAVLVAPVSGEATVRLWRCRIRDGSAEEGSALANDGGEVRIERCTIDANEATEANTGVIVNLRGRLEVLNSTISGNTGGGVASFAAPSTSDPDTRTLLRNTTLYRNAGETGSGANLTNEDGADAQLTHVLLAAQETNGVNCNGPIDSNGYNLSDDASCDFANVGDQDDVDADVDPLHDNGGPTETHALQADSAALDGGIAKPCLDFDDQELTIDQRNQPRGTDGDRNGSYRCDIGAYEAPGPLPSPEPASLLLGAVSGSVLARLYRQERRAR